MSFFEHFTTSSKAKQVHIFQAHLEISAKYPSVLMTSSSFSPIGRKQNGQVFCHFFFAFIFISWRLITLQYCSDFCHTLTWILHGFTCILHPDPFLPLLNKVAFLPGSSNIFSISSGDLCSCLLFLFPLPWDDLFLCCNFLKFIFSCFCCSVHPVLWNIQTIWFLNSHICLVLYFIIFLILLFCWLRTVV